MKTKNKWLSAVTVCDCCGEPFGQYFYDADVGGGQWGLACEDCFILYGCSLGIGHGQKYITKTREGIEGFKE